MWIDKNYDGYDLTGQRNPYYQYVFDKAENAPNLIVIVIDTWNVDEEGFETAVMNTPTEHLIKNFFDKWN